MNFSHDTERRYIYGDNTDASGSEEKLIDTEKTVTSRRMCIVRDWSITPEVEMTGGGCALSTMGFELSEV